MDSDCCWILCGCYGVVMTYCSDHCLCQVHPNIYFISQVKYFVLHFQWMRCFGSIFFQWPVRALFLFSYRNNSIMPTLKLYFSFDVPRNVICNSICSFVSLIFFLRVTKIINNRTTFIVHLVAMSKFICIPFKLNFWSDKFYCLFCFVAQLL